MLKVVFDVQGEQQYARAFADLAGHLGNLQPAFEQIAEDLVHSTGEQFDTQGSHGGRPWQPLSTSYGAWKEEHYPGRPLLVRTGAMREAILTRGTQEIGPRRLVWGVGQGETNDQGQSVAEYAAAHQSGEGHMPQRRLIDVTLPERRGWDRHIVEHLHAVRDLPWGGLTEALR